MSAPLSKKKVLSLAAARGIQLVDGTPSQWTKRCAALGRPIKSYPNPSQPNHNLYDFGDVRKVLASFLTAGKEDEFNDHSGHWIWLPFAASRYHIPAGTLLTYCSDGCALLEGKRVRSQVRLIQRSQAPKVRSRTYVLESDLKKVVAAKSRAGGGSSLWLTRTEAASEFGFTIPFLQRWGDRPNPLLGRVIRTKSERRDFDHHTWDCRVYFRPDLEELFKRRESKETTKPAARITATEAYERFGFHPATIDSWRTRYCPWLGRQLKFVKMPGVMRDRGRTKLMRYYLVSDFEAIAAAKARANGNPVKGRDGLYRGDHGRVVSFAEAESAHKTAHTDNGDLAKLHSTLETHGKKLDGIGVDVKTGTAAVVKLDGSVAQIASKVEVGNTLMERLAPKRKKPGPGRDPKYDPKDLDRLWNRWLAAKEQRTARKEFLHLTGASNKMLQAARMRAARRSKD